MSRWFLPLTVSLGAVTPLFLDTAVKGAALLAFTLGLMLLLKRASAAARHLVWLIAMAALLLIPLLSAGLPQWRILPAWAATERATPPPVEIPIATPVLPAPPAVPATEETGWPEQRVRLIAHPTPPETDLAAASSPLAVETLAPAITPPPSRWPAWLPLVWALGAGLCGLRLLAAYVVMRRRSAACPEITRGPLIFALQSASTSMGISSPVRLRLDLHRTIPVVWGVFRHTLVLPAEAESWEPRQLRSVLLHELAHVKRRDLAAHWLTQLACALHWFNPLVWLAAWRLHTERERACDDLVLTSGVRASDYAEHLLHVATRLQGSSGTVACSLAMARPSRLEGRLVAVLSQRLNRRRVPVLLALGALVIGAGIAIPLSMLKAAEQQVWLSPQAAHLGSAARSSYCVSEGSAASFILSAAGAFQSETTSTSNSQTQTWTDTGTITLPSGKKFTFRRERATAGLLKVNDLAYDLTSGRVFCLADDAPVRQLPLTPPAIRDQAALKALDEQIQAVTRPGVPRPHSLSAVLRDNAVDITVPSGPRALVFRVGDGPDRLFGVHLPPSEEPVQRTLRLLPGDLPYAERLAFGTDGQVPALLPPLPKGWLPEGGWAWRTQPTTVPRPNGQSALIIADVYTPDGRSLPVSLESWEPQRKTPFPTFSTRVQIEARGRLMSFQEGTPAETTKMSLAALGRLTQVPEAGLVAPAVTTKPGNRAVIEIIQERKPAPDPIHTGVTFEIEPTALERGVQFVGRVSLHLDDRPYASLKEAVDQALRAIPAGIEPPQQPKVRAFEVPVGTILQPDECLVVPLPGPGLTPETPVFVITVQQSPVPAPAAWIPPTTSFQIESWQFTLTDSTRAALTQTLGLAPEHFPTPGQPLPMPQALNDPARWAATKTTPALDFSAMAHALAVSTPGQPVSLPAPHGPLQAAALWNDQQLQLKIQLAPGAPDPKSYELAMRPDAAVLLWLPPGEGQPPRGCFLTVRRTEEPGLLLSSSRRAQAQTIKSVRTTPDAAEILPDAGVGSLLFTIGEGPQARTLTHPFGSAAAPVIFRVAADHRQGEWWNEVTLQRPGEGSSLFPVLPATWLPKGRVVFAAASTTGPDGSYHFGDIVAENSRTPLRVRVAKPAEVELSSLLIIPRTCPQTEIILDSRVHALAGPAPTRPVTLSIMAAQDLVGVPKTALSLPYLSGRPNQRQTWSGQGNETLALTATLEDSTVKLHGSYQVRFAHEKYPSAATAWKRNNSRTESDSTVRSFEVPIQSTIGGNETLLVPIDTAGLFPEKVVLAITPQRRVVSRTQWTPPDTRPAIAMDGWVFTWTPAEQEWFASILDDSSTARLLQHLLTKRGQPEKNVRWSETVTSLAPAQIDQLVSAFQRKQGSVKIERVAPFAVPPANAIARHPGNEVRFTAGGQPALASVRVDERHLFPRLEWTQPVLSHLTASDSHGIFSGDSLLLLLPGPVNPQEIRLLALRCTDPARPVSADAPSPPAAVEPAPSEKAPAGPAPTTAPVPPADLITPEQAQAPQRREWLAEGRVTDAQGQPMAEVEIWVHTGMGSLFRTGFTKTDAQGRYRTSFTPGFLGSDDSANLQIMLVSAHRPGFFEKNLNRQGKGAMANRAVGAASLSLYGIELKDLALPGQPHVVDFVMLPAARIKGRLTGEGTFSKLTPDQYRKNPETVTGSVQMAGEGLKRWHVWLQGQELPPGSSVMCTAETDDQGNFEMKDVPVGFTWRFLTESNRDGARDPLSDAFQVKNAGESSATLVLPSEQKALLIKGAEGLEAKP